MAAAVLACDWGTTNLRAWALDASGQVVGAKEFALGVSRLAPGEAAERFRTEVRPALGAEQLPAILCGMIGSNLGWRAAPYVPCPADLARVAAALLRVEEGVLIAPGVKSPGLTAASDVMRGEETQILGWVSQSPDRRRGRHLVCHPGTHAKWALVEDGAVGRFVTAMTGELFAVLRAHSVLRQESPVDDDAAFDAGLAAAGDGGALAARLFSARARVVGDGAEARATPSYLSGLLIGAEVAAMRDLLQAEAVTLIGDADLCRWYARALDHAGVAADFHDGEAAAIAGLFALAGLGGLL